MDVTRLGAAALAAASLEEQAAAVVGQSEELLELIEHEGVRIANACDKIDWLMATKIRLKQPKKHWWSKRECTEVTVLRFSPVWHVSRDGQLYYQSHPQNNFQTARQRFAIEPPFLVYRHLLGLRECTSPSVYADD